ncbi:MAG: nuclear transport factor 2 family protein [Propionibacteriaceae bacterium]
MPWFPDFVSAVELARSETRNAGRDDPVGLYFRALNTGNAEALESAWPGEVVVYDPRAGVVRGHRELRQFVQHNQTLLTERRARIETVAATSIGGRAVVELLAHLDYQGRQVAWPVAVVAVCPDDSSVVFRTYCSQWPVDGRRHVRPAILGPGVTRPPAVVAHYQEALESGDVEALISAFAVNGYVREPIGDHYTHRGSAELREYFSHCFGAGGGIRLQPCAVTDDGVRCAVEYNCLRWGSHDLTPQAGLAVYERAPSGQLIAVRSYDDVEPPTNA